jgi:Fur family ferric uptake transcriptional regulator
MVSRIEQKLIDKGIRMTQQRRIVADILSDSSEHLSVEALHKQIAIKDPSISIATVYRTVRLFEEVGIVESHDFGQGRAFYEEISTAHHDHLIDIDSGKVIEFTNETIEALQHIIAADYGYQLIGHKLELYGVHLTVLPKNSLK